MPRPWPRRLLIGANVIVVTALLIAVALYGYINWRLGQIARLRLASLSATGRDSSSLVPFTLLVVGSDSRAGLDPKGSAQFGSAVNNNEQLADVILLVRVVPKTAQMALLSIPRDLVVSLPGGGTDRINAAFSAGPDQLIATIHQDFGIEVNHYVQLNFDTFRQVSAAVGGVAIYFPTPAYDNDAGLNITTAGCNVLAGESALSFVRSRKYHWQRFPGQPRGSWPQEGASDIARIQRQQLFIKKLAAKAESSGLTNPIALNRLIGGITTNVKLDSGFSTSLMLNLAKRFRTIDTAAVPSATMPWKASERIPGALEPIPGEDQRAVQQFLGTGVAPPPSDTTSLATTTTLVPSSTSSTGPSTSTTTTTTVYALPGTPAGSVRTC